MDLIPNVMDMSVCHCRPPPVTLQYVLIRNLKDLVGTEDFLNRLELTFHQFLHLINFASFLSTCC